MNLSRIEYQRKDTQDNIAATLKDLVSVINSELSALDDDDAPVRSVSILAEFSVVPHEDIARRRVSQIVLADVAVRVRIEL